MICIWLRRVVLAESSEEMRDALLELQEAKDEELAGLYWRPVNDPFVRETFVSFDWRKLWLQLKLENQNRPKYAARTERPVTSIRSLS